MHDILEDTECSERMLREEFSEHTAELVVTLTHKPGESRRDYIARIIEDESAAQIKMADIFDNLGRVDQIPDIRTKLRLVNKYQTDLQQMRDANVFSSEISSRIGI
jgi:(p)ppGpp synthase/HD superfamily hydrolase